MHRVRAIAALALVCATVAACTTSPKATLTGWTRLDPNFSVAPFGTVNDVSCASPTLCVAVGSTGPTAWWGPYGNGVGVFDGLRWVSDDFPLVGRPHCVGPGLCAGTGKGLGLVSCVSPNFCMAIDTVSESWVYNGRSWREIPLPFGLSPKIYQYTTASLSCASPTFCMAVDGVGIADTFNGTSWKVLSSFWGLTSVGSVWCGSAHHCILFGGTQNYEYNGTSFTAQGRWPAGSLGKCPYRAGCLFSNGFVVPAQPGFQGVDVDGLSCVSGSFCLAFDGDASVEGLMTYRYNGTRWIPAGQLKWASGSDFLDCLSPSFCAVIDGAGYIWIWH